MIICHITSAHPWNDVRIFHKECSSLAAANHEVHLVAKNAPNGIRNGVVLHGFEPSEGRLRRVLLDVNQAIQLAIVTKADVFHLHDPELLIGLKTLKKSGAKVVFDAHEDLAKQTLSKAYIPALIRKPLSRFLYFFEHQKAKQLDGLIGATQEITRAFERNNFLVSTITNYPMLEEFSELQESGNRKRQCCYAGGISLIRGVKEIVSLAEAMPKVKFVLAGPISNDGSKEIIAYGETLANVEYAGVLNREEVVALYAQSSIGLLPFHQVPNHQNSVPNKMFEYMAAGLALAATPIESWRLIIADEGVGQLVDFQDTQRASARINEMLDNEDLILQMGEIGKSLIRSKYNWESESERLVTFYSRI